MIKTKKVILFCLIMGVLVLVFPMVWSGYPPSEINCKREYINIKTGHTKHIGYYWYVKIYERIIPSDFTNILGIDEYNAENDAYWRGVNIFQYPFLNISPNCIFHSAFALVNELTGYMNLENFNDQQKRDVVIKVIEYWQKHDECPLPTEIVPTYPY